MKKSLLDNILTDALGKKPFALLYRPQALGKNNVEIITGDIHIAETLESIPLSKHCVQENSEMSYSTLVLIPYKQLKERNFEHVDDDSQLIAMSISALETIPLQQALTHLPQVPIELIDAGFDIDDDSYADIARNIIKKEIGYGEGSNFVIKRQFTADISDYSIKSSLSIFRHLLENESGAYWTFLIHTGFRTLVGASPELHINLNKEKALMNPISGTYRYPTAGPSLEGVLDFLSMAKEADELSMVVEEELKMISHFCPLGGKVIGPYLKEMSSLAHTEYFVKGKTLSDPRDILRETLFAPTVTGSPIENACRVIKKYEPKGRGYYSGVGALVGADEQGNHTLDSTILIRTADIDNKGHIRIGVGATIVRHSDPVAEATETRAKAKALLNAMNVGVKTYV